MEIHFQESLYGRFYRECLANLEKFKNSRTVGRMYTRLSEKLTREGRY